MSVMDDLSDKPDQVGKPIEVNREEGHILPRGFVFAQNFFIRLHHSPKRSFGTAANGARQMESRRHTILTRYRPIPGTGILKLFQLPDIFFQPGDMFLSDQLMRPGQMPFPFPRQDHDLAVEQAVRDVQNVGVAQRSPRRAGIADEVYQTEKRHKFREKGRRKGRRVV